MSNGANAAAAGGAGLGGFFIGMLVGAVVGGLAALLLTPKTGAETREMVRNRFNQMKSMIRSNADEMKRMAEETR